MGLHNPRERGVRLPVLVRESNTQLLRYLLDTHISYSTYYLIQEGSIEALKFYYNFLMDYLINYLIDVYVIGFIIITS